MKRDVEKLEWEVPSKESLGALNAALKQEEEIDKYIEKNQLSCADSAIYIWSRGSQGQKVGMVRRLPKTVVDFDARKVSQLLREMQDTMWSQAAEVQIASAEIMSALLSGLSPDQLSQVLAMTSTLLGVSCLEVRQSWSSLLLEVVKVLPMNDVINEIIPLMMKKGEHSEPSDQRVLCTQLVGALCGRLSVSDVTTKILPRALSLCQDTDIKIRAAMCVQLVSVSKAVGVEVAKQKITVELFELLEDEEKLVACAAFSCLIDMIDFFDVSYRRNNLFPIIRSYLQHPKSELQSLLTAEFGRLVVKLKSDIQGADDLNLFASFFRQSAAKSDAEIRRNAAFNLPAIVASLPTSFASHLYPATKQLACDVSVPVRRSLAAGMLTVSSLLGDKAAFFLQEPFSLLIKDSEMSVRDLLMPNLADFLELFSSQLRGEEREAFFLSIIPGLVSYAQHNERQNWRKMALLLSAMPSFPHYFPPHALFEKFVPILLHFCKFGASSLRPVCCDLLALFSSKLSTNHIADVFGRVNAELRRSHSCYHRIAFLQVFRSSTKHFSRKFLRERCVEAVAELQKDPVACVRLELSRSLIEFRKALRGCTDASMNDSFNSACQRLQMDEDELVRSAARTALDEIKKIETEWSRKQNAGDEEDAQREASEGGLVELIREQKNTERRHKLKELLRESDFDSATARRIPSGNRLPVGRGLGAPSTTTSSASKFSSTTSTTARRTNVPGKVTKR